MFTGLVEGTGVIAGIEDKGIDRRLRIEPHFQMGEVVTGESISISGACLTVVNRDGNGFVVDVSYETLSRTTLGSARVGRKVNIERALRIGDRLGGHIVLGHVDAVGIVKGRRDDGRSIGFDFEIPERFAKYVIEKGSIAIDGVSLTVNSVKGRIFDVNIIPHTAQITTIGLLRPGDEVNIEVDVIGKYVERLLAVRTDRESGGISEELLRKYGFL